MPKQGPIIIAEDDVEDQEILTEAFTSLGIRNQLKFFKKGDEVLDYLMTTTDRPFLIISDVNLLGMNGHELKRRINDIEYLRKKAIPFVFLTTTVDPRVLGEAYEMMVQGYFQKENTIEEIKRTLKLMIDYWTVCKHPNS